MDKHVIQPPMRPTMRSQNENMDAEWHPLAISSLVCSLTGFVLGCFLLIFGLSLLAIIFPILGIVFGHIANASCKTNLRYKSGGMATAGLVLGYIQVLLGLISVLLLVLAMVFVFMMAEGLSSSVASAGSTRVSSYAGVTVEAPVYSTLLGEDLSGSGFHFEHEGDQYIACSLHQFNNVTPATMGHMDFDASIEITERLYAEGDIQVLTFKSEELQATEPLSYDPTDSVTLGDPVYIYNFDEVFSGYISTTGFAERPFEITMQDTYPAQGNSGSPVVSAITGNVIGVVLSANDTEEADRVDFQRLSWTR